MRKQVDVAQPDRVKKEPGETILGKCCACLLGFVYDEIEVNLVEADQALEQLLVELKTLKSSSEQLQEAEKTTTDGKPPAVRGNKKSGRLSW